MQLHHPSSTCMLQFYRTSFVSRATPKWTSVSSWMTSRAAWRRSKLMWRWRWLVKAPVRPRRLLLQAVHQPFEVAWFTAKVHPYLTVLGARGSWNMPCRQLTIDFTRVNRQICSSILYFHMHDNFCSCVLDGWCRRQTYCSKGNFF